MPDTINFDALPKFTHQPTYRVNFTWNHLQETLESYNVNMDPDFQRDHVWTPAQQQAYIEFRLSGGMTGHEIYINKADLYQGNGEAVLVDGKQRIQAVQAFMANKLSVFGGYRHMDIENFPRLDTSVGFILCVNQLKTRAEILRWYLEMNSGGVVHTKEELDRVQQLLRLEEQGVSLK